MTRQFFLSLVLAASSPLWGQLNNPNTYNALSARVQAINYEIPNEELDDLSFTYALELGLRRQFSKHIGIMAPLRIGVIDIGEFENPVIVGVDLLAQIYPLGTQGRISPYVHGGIGVQSQSFESTDRYIPAGLGFNILLGENSWLGLQGEYRLSNNEARDNVQFGIGYIYRLSSLDNDRDGIVNKEDNCPDVFGLPATGGCPDADNDGIPDGDDLCPQIPGNRSLQGCPDKDNDGITDSADKCPDEPGPAVSGGCPDRDEDGVADADDECPDVAGLVSLNGCPDTDGDGVPDQRDQCPETVGDPEHDGCPDTDGDGRYDNVDKCPTVPANTPNGCPLADSDGDGFPDNQDDCPNEAGPLQGCPDTDGDGIANARDRCPTQAGPASNNGCPEITEEVRETLEFAAEAVEFETGSAQLKQESYVILSQIAAIMKQYPDYRLIISGHTDNVGAETTNQQLSERRAEACKNFLLATGIAESRFSYAGYGESRPKASNDTAEGRRMNRRVEFDLQPVRN